MASLTFPSFCQLPHYLHADALPRIISRLPRHGSIDDYVAMAVLTVLYLLRGIVWDQPDPYLYKMYERPREKLGSVKANTGTRNISEKLDKIGADIVILWGSQSGTAERFAHRLAKEILQRFGKRAWAVDCSDCEPESLKSLAESRLALFIASTFGEGEPSDNINDLWAWLNSTNGLQLAKLKYAAFGLGNSNYKHYNAVIDHIAQRLDSLGAHAMLPVGKADDAKGKTEEHYLDWKEQVFNLLASRLGFQQHDPVYEPSVNVDEDTNIASEHLNVGHVFEQTKTKFTAKKISPVHAVTIKQARELFDRTENGRNCIHMELDLNEHAALRYKTGDHLGV